MLDLESAIQHCEEKAKELRNQVDTHIVVDTEEIGDCIECANEHEQLAGWLKELKEFKEAPKGDLISREALKENEPHYDEEGYRIFYESEIDNAPTVEVSGLPKIHYDRGFIAGYEKGKTERPQGECCGSCYLCDVADCKAKMKGDTE